MGKEELLALIDFFSYNVFTGYLLHILKNLSMSGKYFKPAIITFPKIHLQVSRFWKCLLRQFQSIKLAFQNYQLMAYSFPHTTILQQATVKTSWQIREISKDEILLLDRVENRALGNIGQFLLLPQCFQTSLLQMRQNSSTS